MTERIRAAESGKKPAALDETASAAKRDIRDAALERIKLSVAESKDVRDKIDVIATLVKAGKGDLALKEAKELKSRYPDNPAVGVMADNVGVAARLDEAKELVDRHQKTSLQLYNDLVKSTTAPKGDVEFDPKRFREISEARKPKVSEKLKAILTALDTPIEIDVKETTFDDLLRKLSDKIKQPILIDKSSLSDAMLELSTPTSFRTPGEITVRSALKSVLSPYGLTYIVKDDTIQVVTLQKARETTTTKAYYIGDLVQGVGAFGGGAVKWGPWIDQMQTQENVKQLIDSIKKGIDPDGSRDTGAGGNNSVTFHWPSMSVIVRGPTEVHARLGGSFGK